VDSVLQLFEGFRQQLPQALLFLKTVRQVEVGGWVQRQRPAALAVLFCPFSDLLR
jgi:hypothetical protein